jgi:hypothetical protein
MVDVDVVGLNGSSCGFECGSEEELALHALHCHSHSNVNMDVYGDQESTFGAKSIELVPTDDPSQLIRFGSQNELASYLGVSQYVYLLCSCFVFVERGGRRHYLR